MKDIFPPFRSSLFTVAMIALTALSLPEAAQAKPDKKSKSSGHDKQKGKPDSRQEHQNRDSHDHDQVRYHSRPRSTFTLNFGTGYAGRGYYYGPANSSYYYRRSDVRYYSTRESAPSEYYRQGGYQRPSVGASVQRALARQGYYRGSIDGQIGPYSQRCIARYQADRGLRPTGIISSSLLRSLGLE